jgi:Tfp pilus assembly protein PilF
VALAQTALRSGDTATARASAMRVLQLDPRNADALAVLRQVGG